jgi:hypothetical protein
LGQNCLRLVVNGKAIERSDGKKSYPPALLERTFLAVHSPQVKFQPGTWVEISGWFYIPTPIGGTADGFLFYDSAAGEPMGIRMTLPTGGWKRLRMFRKVPETGTIQITVALTGLGQVFADDLRIEPFTNAPPERSGARQ